MQTSSNIKICVFSRSVFNIYKNCWTENVHLNDTSQSGKSVCKCFKVQINKPINTLYCGLAECHYRKSSIEIYKLTKVPSIFNQESVGWNLNKRMFKSITRARQWIKHFSNTTSMIYLLEDAEIEGFMKLECSCVFLSSDKFHPPELLTYFIHKF